MSTGGCAKSFTPAWCRRDTGPSADGRIDALYVTAEPAASALALCRARHRLRRACSQKKTDAVYVTRFQKERWTDKATGKELPYPKIDAKFLGEAKYSDASVMHPLPRVNELDA